MQAGQIYLAGTGLATGGASVKNSYIMYQNLMPECTVTAGGDVSRLYDWMTNIQQKAAAGVTTIDLTLPVSSSVNCAALAGVNWQSGGVDFKFYTWNGSSYVLQVEGSNFNEGQPFMRIFNQVYTTQVRFVFTSTSALFVGEAAFGEALQMPSCPAVGLQPGEWSDDDEISLSVTQSRNIGASTIERRGSTQQMQFNYITPEFIDGQINNMRYQAKGHPIWVGWNQLDRPASVIFGNWSMQPPKFDTSIFTSINMTIKGVA